ncbi:MAG TPA: hypothetical protein VMQ81_02115 [Acidimicrobiia bacterium]|nr:hypothetical protein [Acidimicrobiia bacterium]
MKMRRLLLAVVAVAALTATATSPAPAAPEHRGGSRAVVIVDTGGGARRTVITFSGSISGLGALQAAGANPETIDYGGSLGQAVCKLYGVGDNPDPSSCPDGWRYYRATGGAGGWSYSGAGPSNTTVRDGDVEGWGYNTTPPFSSFCSVAGCAPPPPPPPAPGGGSGGTGSGGTGSGGGSGGGTSGGTGGGGIIPPVPIPPELAGTTTTVPGATTPESDAEGAGDPTKAEKKEKRDKDRELATELTSDSGGGGPPASLLLFLVILAALVAGTLLARRARRDRAAKPAETRSPGDAARPATVRVVCGRASRRAAPANPYNDGPAPSEGAM